MFNLHKNDKIDILEKCQRKGVRHVLEYLFDFLEKNILLVFLCVLFLGIASIYSKGIKFLFFSILGASAAYFGLLCLYRLGIGIEVLYDWSCQCVIHICNQIDYYNILFANHFVLLSKLIELVVQHSFSGTLLYLIHISAILALITLFIEIVVPRIKIYIRKIRLYFKNLNKKTYFSYTINRTQSKFILNSVLRC